jgi:hypothetical protein
MFFIDDMMYNIFEFLPYKEAQLIPIICKDWRRLSKDVDRSYLTEYYYDSPSLHDVKVLLQHYKTIQTIYIKNIHKLELWVPVPLMQLRKICIEKCTFDTINNFLNPKIEHIKIIDCKQENKEKSNSDLFKNIKSFVWFNPYTIY